MYWLESRPDEGGRVAVVRYSLDGKATDAIPQAFNARTRAHEYGGGAYFVQNNTIFFSNFKDQRLYRQEPKEEPLAITPEPATPGGLRYADGRVTPDGKTIVCVRERHEQGREAINELVETLTPVAHHLGCAPELRAALEVAERGPSYLRQRAVVAGGGTLVDVVDSLIEELETDRPRW